MVIKRNLFVFLGKDDKAGKSMLNTTKLSVFFRRRDMVRPTHRLVSSACQKSLGNS